jgi:hypothetical protein
VVALSGQRSKKACVCFAPAPPPIVRAEKHDLRETDTNAIYETKLPARISAFAKIVVSIGCSR